MAESEGFLQRWSRLKQTGEADEPSPEKEDAALEPGQEEAESEIEAQNRAAAEAVDLESLTYESDYSVFFRKGVPTALKNAAMRKLWTSNPVLACVDGLNDYDEDFRIASHVGDQVKSAWEVGRGYARKLEAEAERAAAAAKAAKAETEAPAESFKEEAPAEVSTVSEPPPLEAKTPASEPASAIAHSGEEPAEDLPPEDRPRVSLRRRMSFGEG
ncbi:DUF3306 domain-containing protein [Rhizobiales bacterium]|uniref:DUF3306 domain-containing protein n=1 Tax=Hongsoonwoonella zoysiae TaxID=2821844 RepID=UPI00155FFAEC|nr:DUF3306 domain-containing protein [Hongsoonwoonella zoysiae]NRG18370.1 DUF3306 domain-containing protein [Hongsoonwoonella zoysiae]